MRTGGRAGVAPKSSWPNMSGSREDPRAARYFHRMPRAIAREALDHLLLFGPPGLGKTTLAHIVAAEMGVNLRQTSGPVLERPGDLAALLTNLEKNDVLFIDEIHRLSPVVEEILYPALEDYQIDIMIGEGPGCPIDQARSAAVHTGRRDDSCRHADQSATRPLRYCRRASSSTRSSELTHIVSPLGAACSR